MCRTTGSSSGSHTDVTFRVFMHAGQRGGALYILEPLFLIACNAGDGSFSFSFLYNDILWVYGLKTGQYDSHVPGSLGGTLVVDNGEALAVTHIPSLVPFGPCTGQARYFKGFFAEDKVLL